MIVTSRVSTNTGELVNYVKWTLPLTILLATDSASADEWWGPDKALHFALSATISSTGYAMAVPFTDQRGYRALTGAAIGIAAGATKEVYDATGRGDPSFRDFAWDIAGTAVGVLIAYAIDQATSDGHSRTTSTASATSALTISF